MLPLILVTNDDGLQSPGLLAAAEALADLGELLIVAPATQQTGMGRSSPIVTNGVVTQSVLRVNGRNLPAYAVPGSPAQSVMYGVLALAERRPALAVAGINYGENVGLSTTASGTVGAALEAAVYGVPALAVSLETVKAYHYNHGGDVDWQVAAGITAQFAAMLLSDRMPFDVDVLKVDVPADATDETPWRLTHQSRQRYYETFRVNASPLPELGHFDYQITIDQATLEPDSDVYAFAVDRVVSVTPLSIDLTSRADFPALRTLLQAQIAR